VDTVYGLEKNISLAELHELRPEVLRGFELELADRSSMWDTRDGKVEQVSHLTVCQLLQLQLFRRS
jgi:hypothetical protein